MPVAVEDPIALGEVVQLPDASSSSSPTTPAPAFDESVATV